MGQWGIRSYDGDDAADALDAAFDRVHGARYEELMDDRNPMPFEAVQQALADARTLAAAVGALRAEAGDDFDDWDEVERLAFAGVIVRHAECGLSIPDDWRRRAIDWLEHEDIDWDEPTARHLRRRKEIDLLQRSGS